MSSKNKFNNPTNPDRVQNPVGVVEVIYEDNHLIAINKQAGDLVQGDETGDEPLSEKVKQYIQKKYQKPGAVFLGVVHRLDRPVSGVVLFARTSKALTRLNALFQKRETKKTYWAIVQKRPRQDQATLIHWLRKNEQTNKVTLFENDTPDTLRCELSYKVLQEKKGLFLLEVLPVTGRSHQIRAQLASMGCPIVGDLKYGSSEASGQSICLHARQLQLVHPVKKELLAISASLPANTFWNEFNRA
jgi:23S rRNA pseudouridine1911/1915/1917 synthase